MTHLRPLLLAALLTACNYRDVDGLWTGECTIGDLQDVLSISMEIERQRRDLDGSGTFQFTFDSRGPDTADTGYYDYFYGRHSGYGGSARRFGGDLDGRLRGDDIEIEILLGGAQLEMEGTLSDERIAGTCTVGPEHDYGYYVYASYPRALSGDLTLKRR